MSPNSCEVRKGPGRDLDAGGQRPCTACLDPSGLQALRGGRDRPPDSGRSLGDLSSLLRPTQGKRDRGRSANTYSLATTVSSPMYSENPLFRQNSGSVVTSPSSKSARYFDCGSGSGSTMRSRFPASRSSATKDIRALSADHMRPASCTAGIAEYAATTP